jgi:hypothetical protein
MPRIRVRDVLIVLPLLALSAVCFVFGQIEGGVGFLVIAAVVVFLLLRHARIAARAAANQSTQDIMLRWQYPGNSGGGL